MSVTRILETIGSLTRPLTERDMRGLSGLGQIDRRDFLETWAKIPAVRRVEIAREMVELSEEHVGLDLGPIWNWLLNDQDPMIRTSAIEGLWEDTSERAMRQMLNIMRQDPSEDVRAAAAAALSRFAYLQTLDELDADGDVLERGLTDVALNEGEPLEVRRRALESAGYFADNEGVQRQIERDYAKDDQLLRESALVAMGRSMLPRWMPVIEKAMTNQSPALRYEACRAAGEMAEEARGMLPAIAPLLNDTDTEVVLAAIWALGQIGGEAAQRLLQQVSRSEDQARSQAATEALEELRAGESLI